MLREHDAVAEVLYPDDVRRSPRRQMRDFGGMVSFLAADEDAALELVTRTRSSRWPSRSARSSRSSSTRRG